MGAEQSAAEKEVDEKARRWRRDSIVFKPTDKFQFDVSISKPPVEPTPKVLPFLQLPVPSDTQANKVEPEPRPLFMNKDSDYQLFHVKGPRYVGSKLKSFVARIEDTESTLVTAKMFMIEHNLFYLRYIKLLEPPIYHPLHRYTDDQVHSSPSQMNLDSLCLNASFQTNKVYLSVQDFATAYRAGTASPVDVAKELTSSSDFASKLFKPLNALIKVDNADIIKQAEQSQARFQSNAPLSILDGVPVVINDNINLEGIATGFGSYVIPRTVKAEAALVQRLRKAGAIIVGKANMGEFATGALGSNLNSGIPRNPHNPEHYTGGSSSGCGAVVGSGLTPIAIGYDSVGGVRIPAGLCGVYGLVATYGRISMNGVLSTHPTTGNVGIMAGNARDLALAYAVVSGPDTKDPNTAAQPPVHLDKLDDTNLGSMKIGIHEEFFNDATEEVVKHCKKAVEDLQRMGCKLIQIEIPELEEVRVASLVSSTVELAASVNAYKSSAHMETPGTFWTKTGEKNFMPESMIRVVFGENFTSQDYVKAQQMRARFMRFLDRIFQDVDVIAVPTTACTAPFIAADALSDGECDTEMTDLLTRFSHIANFAGIPSIVIPVGFDSNNMPISIQLMTRWWDEATLLRIAIALEQFAEPRVPQVYFDLLKILKDLKLPFSPKPVHVRRPSVSSPEAQIQLSPEALKDDVKDDEKEKETKEEIQKKEPADDESSFNEEGSK